MMDDYRKPWVANSLGSLVNLIKNFTSSRQSDGPLESPKDGPFLLSTSYSGLLGPAGR